MGRLARIVLVCLGAGIGMLWISGFSGAQPLGVTGPRPEASQSQALSAPGGRFVFGQISDSGKDQYMLDTVTGRLWRIAESGAIGVHLKPVPYRDEKGNTSYVPGP